MHHLEQGKVRFVEVDRCAGEGSELEGPADVVDVCMGDEDLLKGQTEAGKAAMDAGDLVAGVDDDVLRGFARRRGWCSCIAAGRRGRFRESWIHCRGSLQSVLGAKYDVCKRQWKIENFGFIAFQ